MRYFEKYGYKIPLDVPVTGTIGGTKNIQGIIVKEHQDLYFLQNVSNGDRPSTGTKSFKYGWVFSIHTFGLSAGVADIKLMSLKPALNDYEIY